MREHLIFLLAAPMASFGGYAGHEHRGSGVVPLRSAVLGLIGAALGIERTDKDGQAMLRTYAVAVQSFRSSWPLRDYHTIETVPTAKAKKPATRREALAHAGRNVNTIVTKRDYRSDVLVGVALWGDGRWSLDKLAAGLKRPHFPLYLGRKSCPLASPVNPKIVTSKDPAAALARIDIPPWLQSWRWSGESTARYPVHSDPVVGLTDTHSSELVPGEPLDRQAWTFGEREVWLLSDRRGEPVEGNER